MSSIRAANLLCSITLVLIFVITGNAQQNIANSDSAVRVSRFTGRWTGALDIGAVRLRLVFDLTESDGKIVAALDSPDQGAKGILLDDVTLDGPTINIASKKMKALFAGKLNDPYNKIEGTWSQGCREFPLVLQRVEGTLERLRPQTPRPPYPYQVDEVG